MVSASSAAVRKKTQGKMALCGGVGSGLIMDGPVEKIVRDAREKMVLLGKEGGYFCGPDQGMPFPQTHITALEKAVEQYGKYPIA
jgi:hypothetical protein